MTLETITSEDMPDEDQEAPRPPPRYKRKVKLRGVENLNLEQINSSEDTDETHQNDILFNVCGGQLGQQGLNKQNDLVEGKREDLFARQSIAGIFYTSSHSHHFPYCLLSLDRKGKS